jgi:hypothetical protein
MLSSTFPLHTHSHLTLHPSSYNCCSTRLAPIYNVNSSNPLRSLACPLLGRPASLSVIFSFPLPFPTPLFLLPSLSPFPLRHLPFSLPSSPFVTPRETLSTSTTSARLAGSSSRTTTSPASGTNTKTKRPSASPRPGQRRLLQGEDRPWTRRRPRRGVNRWRWRPKDGER